MLCGKCSQGHHLARFLTGYGVDIEPFHEYFRIGCVGGFVLGIVIGFEIYGRFYRDLRIPDGRLPWLGIADSVGLGHGCLDNQFEVGYIKGNAVRVRVKALAVRDSVASAGASTPSSEGGVSWAVPPQATTQ